ncbi:pyridoxamine 5'-phosphate oxidase family protein [Streptomyces sp. NPDC048604]|uniref:pyridoxamine 5'-phosphate oxidase family protein n=1 Tax=Streptomyces sp. NPDC048604 TaxID=3365578 RepID=UPI003713F0C1
MNHAELLDFLRSHKLAVEASVTSDGTPQAAVVGYAVSDDLELVFDTLESSRKFHNLSTDPRIALVIGWGDTTLQLEGLADFPLGPERDRLQEMYFATYPDGRDRLAWPGITFVRVRPRWVRYSDFAQEPAAIEEMTL